VPPLVRATAKRVRGLKPTETVSSIKRFLDKEPAPVLPQECSTMRKISLPQEWYNWMVAASLR
jgi:hypothetical protein